MKYVLIIMSLAIFSWRPAMSAGPAVDLIQKEWSFDGFFGTVDRQAAQRGYQVYKEVCASCHSMKLIPFRTLQHIGFSEKEVKTIAASYEVEDGPDDAGDMFMRPARPSDHFPSPYSNENAARASNNGAYPPDLSLMVKARPDGANYLYSLLLGYEDPPSDMKMGVGMYYNAYYPGHQIAMPSPLIEGLVEYMDETDSSKEQMAHDLVHFMQWASEPEMEERKSIGIKVIIYLIAFTLFFYLAKNIVWARLK